jgi:hypothetical protein
MKQQNNPIGSTLCAVRMAFVVPAEGNKNLFFISFFEGWKHRSNHDGIAIVQLKNRGIAFLQYLLYY